LRQDSGRGSCPEMAQTWLRFESSRAALGKKRAAVAGGSK
jgi:hypothetical protein